MAFKYLVRYKIDIKILDEDLSDKLDYFNEKYPNTLLWTALMEENKMKFKFNG